jgi:histone acetyltransferase
MECVIRPKVPYLDIPTMIKNQRRCVYEKIKEISNSHIVYNGIKAKPNKAIAKTIFDVPGISIFLFLINIIIIRKCWL